MRQVIVMCGVVLLGALLVSMFVPQVMPLKPGGSPDKVFSLASGDTIGENIVVQEARRSAIVTCDLPQIGNNDAIHAISVLHGTRASPVPGLLSDMTQIDVYVTDEKQPLVLVLSSRDAVVWNLHIKDNVKISGLIVSGVDRQMVVGVRPGATVASLAVLDHCDENTQKFGFTLGSIASKEDLEAFAQKAFGQHLTGYQSETSGDEFWIGETGDKAVFGAEPPYAIPSDVVGQERPILFGRPAVKRLEISGAIRRAQAEDLQTWLAAAQVAGINVPDSLKMLDLERTYVVKRSFHLPLGLIGDASTAFVVPSGVEAPQGFLAQGLVLTASPFSCRSGKIFSKTCEAMPSFKNVGSTAQ